MAILVKSDSARNFKEDHGLFSARAPSANGVCGASRRADLDFGLLHGIVIPSVVVLGYFPLLVSLLPCTVSCVVFCLLGTPS